MISAEHLVSYLSSIATELEGAVRPKLTSQAAGKSLDSINLLLGRLIAELRCGGNMADTYQSRLTELLHQRFGDQLATAAEADVPGRSLHRLNATIAAMQSRLNEVAEYEQLVASLSRGDVEARAWLQSGVGMLDRMLQGVEDNFYRPAPTAAAVETMDDPELIRRQLGAYLAKRYAGLDAHCVESLHLVPGGQVKRTAVFRLAPNEILPTRLVLRQDMEHSITGTVVSDEYEIIRQVFDLGLPVPEPILIEPDPSILKGQFMVMREVVGGVGAGTYFAEERRYLGHNMGPDFGREVAGFLARLHRMTLAEDEQSEAGEREEAQATAQLLAEYRTGPKPPFSLAVDLGFAWLSANPLPKGRPRCLIHGDMGAHNLMTRDGHLAAVIDWELAKRSDPAEDLAQAKMLLLDGLIPWDEFVRAYVEQGGPAAACDDRAIGHYAVRTFLKHGVMNFRVWGYFTSGARTDVAAASVAGYWADRLMLYLARALNNAVAADANTTGNLA